MLAKLLNISETLFTWMWNDDEDCFKNETTYVVILFQEPKNIYA